MGTQGKPKLTPKRRAFVEKVASGDSPTLAQAYRETYSAEGFTPHALHVEASRLAQHPDVALSIEARRRALDARSGAKLAGGKAYVLRRLRELADAPETPPSAAVSALALLAKASGALDDAVDREAKRASATEDDLLNELEARLAAYSEPAIDVTPERSAQSLDEPSDRDPEVAQDVKNG
jgi:hypothetical protein